MKRKHLLLSGLGMISGAGIMLEVALSNLLGVILSYHYVFMVVSISLLGIGVGAFIVQRFMGNRTPEKEAMVLPLLCLLLAGFIAIFGLWYLLMKPASLWSYILFTVIFFILIGMITARVFHISVSFISVVYGFDLLGSALGTLLGIVIMRHVGAFHALFYIALVPAVAAVFFSLLTPSIWQRRGALLFTAIMAIAVGATTVWPVALDLKGVKGAPPEKNMYHLLNDASAGARIEYTNWDEFARVDVVGTSNPQRKVVYLNGGAGSYMFRFDGNLDTFASFRDSIQYAPFSVVKPRKVLIIGPGGGVDIINALLAGAQDITAVEISQGIINAMEEYSDFNGGLYNYPGVKVHQGDGRNFIKTTTEKYDLILLNLVFTQVAEMSANALTENYIFTREAFQDYMGHLTPNGSVAVIAHHEVEGMRSLFTGLSALTEEMPMKEALKRSAAVMEPAAEMQDRTTLVMVGQLPLDTAPLAEVNNKIDSKRLLPFHIPGRFEQLFKPLENGDSTLDEFIKGMDYNLQPVTDNKPFFFNFEEGLPVPMIHLMLYLAAFTLMIGVLMYIIGKEKSRPDNGADKKKNEMHSELGLYFIFLGLGYMMVEVPLIQKFVLYLYSPSFAAALVLFALLAGSSAGSFISSRFGGKSAWGQMKKATAAAGILAATYSFLLPSFSHLLISLPFTGKVMLSFLMVLPAGIIMGIPFPAGIGVSTRYNDRAAPLFYALNGLASVWGSVLAVVVSVLGGFNLTMLAGGLLYLSAALLCMKKEKAI